MNQSAVDIQTLRQAFEHAWSRETAKGDWTPECPSLNQCAVTALVAQDYFGGELLRCPFGLHDSHYWNRLPDGTQVDFADEQFLFIGMQPDRNSVVIRTREYAMSFPDTVIRYECPRERVQAELSRNV